MVHSLDDDHVNIMFSKCEHAAGANVQQRVELVLKWTSAVDYLMIPSHPSINGHAASFICFWCFEMSCILQNEMT